VTKAELVIALRAINQREGVDQKLDHGDADDLLLEYINDGEVDEAYQAIEKWYA
jgi:hypothetical protein